MRSKLILFIIFLPFLAKASVGQSGIALSTTYFAWVSESKNSVYNAEQNKVSTSLMMTKLNYGLPEGFFFGAAWYNQKDSEGRISIFGPNLGFNFHGFSLGLSYFLNPKERYLHQVEYYDGEVVAAELAYHVNILKYLVLGANITFMKTRYRRARVNGTEMDATIASNNFYPFLSIGFVFDPASSSDLDYGSF